MIQRKIENTLTSALMGKSRKVIVVHGPRQAGKTTLLQKLYDKLPGKKDFLNGDFLDDQALLRPERSTLTRLAAHLDYLFIDEAQNIPDCGSVLKLLHDSFPGLQVVASGSSSFDLRKMTGEPLTGRQVVFELFPVSLEELAPVPSHIRTRIDQSLIYGGYPEVVMQSDVRDKEQLLRQLTADYLLKDIFSQVDVQRDRLRDMLRLLSFQVGSEVSLSELAKGCRLDIKTVDRYLGILEDAYVIIRLGGFSRNLRKEISKSRKVYFWDLGIRNALISAFQPLELRNDLGNLWENYLCIERRKYLSYRRENFSCWFWRTYDQQEIDYVEELNGKLSAYEYKYGTAKKVKFPKIWLETYPHEEARVISPENVEPFIMG